MSALRPGGIVQILVGDPGNTQLVTVPVQWLSDLVYSGSHVHPGVVLESPPPEGVRKAQWDYMLEVIAYAINEGNELMGSYDREDDEFENDEDYDPELGYGHPRFHYRFLGGQKEFDRNLQLAYERLDDVSENCAEAVVSALLE